MLKGFKEFLMRGNVIDLAVAVIIGTAFTAIVTAIADSFIRPIIAAFGGADVGGLYWTIASGNPASKVDFAAILSAVINFMIVAAVVYFLIVLPMKKLQERRRRGEEPPPPEPTDVELLTEIRDLLRQQQSYSSQNHQQGYSPRTQQGYPQQTDQQGYPQQAEQQGYPPQTQQPRRQQPPPQEPRRQY